MKRVPLVVVAIMVAMVSTAAALRWRARARSPGSRLPAPGTSATMPQHEARSPESIGAGVPPDVAGARGARMLHEDARHTHRAAGRAPQVEPVAAWTHDVGGPIEAQVATSPDEQTLYVASLGGALTALARADGAVRWTRRFGDRVYSSPCVADDGTIYVGSDDKQFHALTPEGRTRWTLDVDDEADTGAAIHPKSGAIVFAAGRKVLAVRPNGSVSWRFAAKRKVFTSPAIAADGRVVFGSQDHRVYALDAGGKLAWSIDLGADVDGAPAIGDDGAIFVGTDGAEIVRLDLGDGHVVWRANVGGFVRGVLSVARNGDVLAGVYGPAPRQVRLRADDGSVRGVFAIQGTGAREFGIHGGALEDDAGTLLFGAQDDRVYAVGAGGELLWTLATGGDVDAPVTLLSDGSVVVGSDDGSVRLLRSPP